MVDINGKKKRAAVTLGEGTTRFGSARLEGENVDRAVYMVNAPYLPPGTEDPDLIGVHSDDITEPCVYIAFYDRAALEMFRDVLNGVLDGYPEPVAYTELAAPHYPD